MDDTKLVSQVNEIEDIETVQDRLNHIYLWERNNNMEFNLDKFKWLQLGQNQELKNCYWYYTNEYEDILVPTDETKDLGIMMSHDGSFRSQIQYICSRFV